MAVAAQPQESVSAASISQPLAAFAAGLRFDGIPGEVVERAKLHILDAVGIALASSTEDFAHRIVGAIAAIGGAGDHPVLGFPLRLPMRDAALANGALVHGLDFDDTHSAGIIHVSASALPAALAAARSTGGSGRDLLLAYLVCVETASRIAIAADSGFHVNGFHPTGMVAAFGAVLGVGRAWGLTERQLVDAQGLVLSMASGSFEFIEDGAWNKRLHAGWAVGAAMTSCALARAGVVGARKAYEGRYGLYRSYLGSGRDPRLAACTAGLGRDWEMLQVALKPYPVCHFNHAFIDAALALSRAHAFAPGDIESIVTLVASDQIGIVCEPQANKRRPQNAYDARFSLPFAVATALIHGRLTMDEISDEAIRDPAVLSLCDRTRHAVDAESGYPRHYSGALELRLRDGRVLRHREPVNRGSSDRPLSRDEVQAKFRQTAGRALPPARVDALAAAVLELDRAPGIDALAALACPPRLA
jgi:2-methylcitrate dehydratase PrpD